MLPTLYVSEFSLIRIFRNYLDQKSALLHPFSKLIRNKLSKSIEQELKQLK